MTDPLALDAAAMRALGHATVDLLADLLDDPAGRPALTREGVEGMRRRLDGPAPAAGQGWDELLGRLAEDVLPFASRPDHPGYFAFIPACGTWPGALGDLVASALNIYAGSWMEAAGPSRVELLVLDWFRSWIGYPDQAAGILLSGGSAANMTAMACAREALVGPMDAELVAYVSDQGHSSIARAARTLGFRPDQVRVLAADEHQRMRPRALAAAVEADLERGLRPLFVSASAGATNTGAVDPLEELARVCRARGLWLHVDAAYGGFAALTERGRALLTGIEHADSVTLDPHKWLYQPIECGCLLVREGALLRRAFEITPDYLRDAVTEAEVNFADLGLQLTRTSRALKVWLSISYFGLDAFRAAIDTCLDLALLAQARVDDHDALELLSPATLGIVAFRRRFAGVEDEDELARGNAALVSAWEATGRGLVSSTRLRGSYAVRLCVLNHTSRAEDVEAVLDFFATSPAMIDPAPAAPGTDRRRRHADAGDPDWLTPSSVDDEELRRVALLASAPAGALAGLRASGQERRVPAGEAVTRRWHGDRDLFLVLDGHAEVRLDGRHVRDVPPGDFFGELAALDWGAGYGYARTADVIAATPLRLLAVSPLALAQLIGAAPEVGEALHAAAAARRRDI